jgi:hypothetical protein
LRARVLPVRRRTRASSVRSAAFTVVGCVLTRALEFRRSA